jgi:hypothetical protein
MVTVHADEIQPGDVLVYDGYERRITRVDHRDGWAWPIATDDSGWAVALDRHLVEVRRLATLHVIGEDDPGPQGREAGEGCGALTDLV